MERLTRRNEAGIVLINELDFRASMNQEDWVRMSHKLAERLAAYEDTGLEPDEIKANNWILVSEQEPAGCVLACNTTGEMLIGYTYRDEESETGFTTESDNEIMYNTIAWMPLPEPYKEGK